MIVDREALAWAGGLFEGEGCFCVNRQPSKSKPMAHVELCSTDEETVRRFHKVVGVGNVLGPYTYRLRPNNKPYWKWKVNKFEYAQHIGAILWPWLGERRREAAKSMLEAINNRGTAQQDG